MNSKHVSTINGYITLLIADDGILCCVEDDHYNDTILPGMAYQLGVYLVEKYRPADVIWDAYTSFVAGVMALELGLRWLHDRANDHISTAPSNLPSQ